jgi:hypothetical protein
LKGLYNPEKGGGNRNKAEFLPKRSEYDGLFVWSGERCSSYIEGSLSDTGSSAWLFNFDNDYEYWTHLDNSGNIRGLAVRERE